MRKDNILIVAYILLLLVGIWYAFPNLKVVGDEAPFVGGVLRAIEDKTLIPNIDYSYTVSFYANYFLMFPFILVLFIFFGGDTVLLTNFLMENVYIAYFIPRLLSVISAVVILAIFLKMMREWGRSFFERFVVVSIVFGNIIFFTIAHTGKMWLLSLLLWFLSFYFFSRAIENKVEKTNGMFRDPFFWSPVFAFLSFANFPVNIVALIFVLWLWIIALMNKLPKKSLLYGTISGIVIFTILFAVNYTGWTTQNSITPIGVRDFLGITKYFIYGGLTIMPLFVLYGIFCTEKRRYFSPVIGALIISFFSYLVIIFLRASWVGSELGGYWRYFIYPVFFIGLILAQWPSRRHLFAVFLGVISLLFVLRIDYLLAVPTTHNLAREYIVSNVHKSLIVNIYPYLDLPKNTISYKITADSFCQSRCLYGRGIASDDVGLFVIDAETNMVEFEKAISEAKEYLLVKTVSDEKLYLENAISNGLQSEQLLDIDYNLGPYTIGLFVADRLGPSFFIYKSKR